MLLFRRPSFRVLILCTANICRSPVAAALLAQHLRALKLHREIAVTSAGTNVGMPGAPADPRMVALAADAGVRLKGHRSRGINARLIETADLILAMEEVHLEAVTSEWPESAARCELLDDSGAEVADPYFGSRADVREAFLRINDLCLRRAHSLFSMR
jgi:protein-tyrosine phosphatase